MYQLNYKLSTKKGIGILDSNIWWSNFFKDIVNISYEDYCGSRFNLNVIVMFYGFPSPKKEKKMMNLKNN